MRLAKGETKTLGKTPLEALTFARALIADPKNWCQRTFGDDNQHCAWGALSRSTASGFIGVFEEAFDLLHSGALKAGRHATESIAHWNDRTGHASVIAAFDFAIELAVLRNGPLGSAPQQEQRGSTK